MTPASVYLVAAGVFQAALVLHFALRTLAFQAYIPGWGWIFYALSLPAFAVSLWLRRAGAPVWLWLGGMVFVVWAIFGFGVEYLAHLDWRSPPVWPIFVPYVLLYLATVMLYWWPAATVSRPAWVALGVLFALGTGLNILSH
jgi:hypothetical protein